MRRFRSTLPSTSWKGRQRPRLCPSRRHGAYSPSLVCSLAVYLLDGDADVTEGHTAVYLLDGAAEAVAVTLGAVRPAALPFTSLTGRPRQREGRPRQRERHVVVHPLNGAGEATETRWCPTVHLLVGASRRCRGTLSSTFWTGRQRPRLRPLRQHGT